MKNNNIHRDKKVLITGELGMIGSNLPIKLAGLDAKISILDAMLSPQTSI